MASSPTTGRGRWERATRTLDYPGGVFGRQKTPAAPVETTDSADDSRSASGKGRPTPKRKIAEAANKRPLVPDDRASARKAQREKFAQQRKEQQQALVSGQEDKMPLQHRGPVRRYMRDYVDARFSPGELFLPAAVLVILILLAGNMFPSYIEIIMTVILATYALILLAIVDAVILGYRVRRKATEKFGPDKILRGSVMYVVMRAFYFRRMRMPRPVVKRGEFPV